MEPTNRFEYGPPNGLAWSVNVFCSAYFAYSLYCAVKAPHLNNDSTMCLWTVPCIAGLMLAVSLAATIVRHMHPRYLQLGSNALTVPAGVFFSPEETRISYSSITQVWEAQIVNTLGPIDVLFIEAGGKTHRLDVDFLQDKDSYIRVRDFLFSFNAGKEIKPNIPSFLQYGNVVPRQVDAPRE